MKYSQRQQEIQWLINDWEKNPRWKNVYRPYSAEDVVKLRGSIKIEWSLATQGATKLWDLVNGGALKGYVNCLGAVTGGQALQQAKAGLQAIYLSGWQVAADNNLSNTIYPDLSLYPSNSVPSVVQRINNAFIRADQIQAGKNIFPGHTNYVDYLLPIVADAEAGFGGVLNAYELMRNMIEAGAAGVHFEDQLASAKKCGHMGGKVLVPTQEAINKLVAARLAADVMGVPTLVLARTDANAATLVTSDIDTRDHEFLTGERTAEGFHCVHSGIKQAISRGLSYAPYADLLWCETATPSLEEARIYAEAIHKEFPEQLLAYNCSPSFNWHKHLDDLTIAKFQRELGAMGYKYQFITLAGIHSMWNSMFNLAHEYVHQDMTAYVRLQEKEFNDAKKGYTFVSHQQEVGTGYFDDITQIIYGGNSSVVALNGSTEEAQFKK